MGEELPHVSDGLRGGGTANWKVAAPYDSEIKVTALAGWAIDAPVENNPVRSVRG